MDLQPPNLPGAIAPGMVELHPPGLLQNIILLFLLSLPFIIVITTIGILIKIVISKSSRPRTKKIISLFLTLILSIILVFTTLKLPKAISNINELNNILCGWPMQFIEYTSYANPPLPSTRSCGGWFMGSPMDWTGQFLWQPFLTNVGMFFVVLASLGYTIIYIYKKLKH